MAAVLYMCSKEHDKNLEMCQKRSMSGFNPALHRVPVAQ